MRLRSRVPRLLGRRGRAWSAPDQRGRAGQTSQFIDELRPGQIILVHGEQNMMANLKRALHNRYEVPRHAPRGPPATAGVTSGPARLEGGAEWGGGGGGRERGRGRGREREKEKEREKEREGRFEAKVREGKGKS